MPSKKEMSVGSGQSKLKLGKSKGKDKKTDN